MAYNFGFVHSKCTNEDETNECLIFLEFIKREVYGLGLFYVSCPPGWLLLSCGTESTHVTNFDPMRFAQAVNAQTCECYDLYGMKCSAWCTDKPLVDQVNNITLVQSGTTDSSCPLGSKLTGCGLKPVLLWDFSRNFWTNAHPVQESCSCTDYMGAWCVASCAVNIKKQEISSKTGLGRLFTPCQIPGNTILGCGINASIIGSGNWPFANVLNQTLCQCFADFSYRCYAICGLLFDYV